MIFISEQLYASNQATNDDPQPNIRHKTSLVTSLTSDKIPRVVSYCLAAYPVFLFPILPSTFFLASCAPQDRSAPQVQAAPQATDRIVLTGGGVIEGKIVEETPSEVRIKWQNGVIGFSRAEIESVERGVMQGSGRELAEGLYVPKFESEEEVEKKWPEGVDHLVYLTNGERIGGRIIKVDQKLLTVRQSLEGGGAIEHDLDLEHVEKIELWPVPDVHAKDRFSDFRQSDPDLKLLDKGYYHIFSTEQNPIDLRQFLKALDHFYHDFLLHFFL